MLLNLEEYYTELGGAKNHIFRRNLFYRCDDMLSFHIQEFQKEYRYIDCYQCLYRYSNRSENALLYAPFYLDLDADITSEKKFRNIVPYVARAFIALQQLGLTKDEISLYFSGNKGFHLTVDPRILGIVPVQDLNVIYKAWALYLYHTYAIPILDLRIYDKRRLFRMPNTINSKTGSYKVPVTLDFLYGHTYKELLEYASSPKELSNTVPNINRTAALAFYRRSQRYKQPRNKYMVEKEFVVPETKQELLPCIHTILEEGSVQGARNNTLIVLASCLLQSGYTLNETENVVLNWNTLNEPPLKEAEVLSTTHSAYVMLQNGRRYGCASIRELGLCSDNECRIRSKHGN